MKIFFNTSILVDIDRRNEVVITLCRELRKEHEMTISTVTVSEILTGSFLRKDFEKAALKAKKVLGQFSWIELDGKVAEKVGQLNAYLISQGLPIECQDVIIAASCILTNSDYLLTRNKAHFEIIPALENKLFTPEEFIENVIKKNL